LNILMISDVYHPRVNGVSTSIRTFRRELEQRGHNVTLIAPDYPPHHDLDEPVIRIPSRQLPLDPEDRLMSGKIIRQMEVYLRESRFDLIHIQTPFAAHYAGTALARRLGLPVVETYHTFFEEYLYHYIPFLPKSLLRLAARRLSRYQCNRLDAMVVPSHAMLAALRQYGITTPAEIIPTGIDLERFGSGDGAAFRRHYRIPADRPLLLFVGRVAFEKNIDFLLETLVRVKAELPQTLLVIAGEGPALGRLQRRAAALGLSGNVLFIGYLRKGEQLCDCYCAADAFVFASRTETQGLVLLEAMALGVPVVALAAMGTCDILNAQQGALIAQDDTADFAAQILRLLRDAEMRNRLSSEGRQYIHQWTAGAMAERMLAFYRNVVDRSPDAAQRNPGPP
jgi:1,2-diacylglycerol 3-alpha-glucosyltransferase